MGILNSILKVFVGDKSKKDLKEISPFISEINLKKDEYLKLSNDELRNKTQYFKDEIKKLKQPFQDDIDKLKNNIDQEINIDEKEKIYDEIEKIEDSFLNDLDKFLNSILSDAFCVVRETAQMNSI